MSGPRDVFVLQTWIAPRTIQELKQIEAGDCDGFWLWDLNDLFTSLAEAETTRAEFYAEEDSTRIVKMQLVELEVVTVFESEIEKTQRRLKDVQKELFV